MPFQMSPVPKDMTRGWKVLVDGVEQVGVGLVELLSKRFGRLVYGARPEGYDAWVFEEIGGGGSVTLPWARTPERDIVVALILEERPNLSGKHWCVIGGFKEIGETHVQAQARESAEEAGLDTTRAMLLPGLPTVSNRLFFVADPKKKEGVHVYALEVPFSWLREADMGFRLREGTEDDNIPKRDAVRFMHWKVAVKESPDALARSAIAQLLAEVL